MSSSKFNIDFISQKDFEAHVAGTVASYAATLCSIDLAQFNRNVIDPIKLTFDKALFQKNVEEVIADEIQRQRDKSNSNSIGYFHQNLFRFVKNCEVPPQGFDIIFSPRGGGKIYVEMKNKHNTMNSSSAQKTYIGMQNQIMREPTSQCWLVEVIAPCSRDIAWGASVNGKHLEDERIRRISVDRFYAKVTGIENAFAQVCRQLPKTIEKLIRSNEVAVVEKDSVFAELKKKNPDLLKALYLLAFDSYLGFENF